MQIEKKISEIISHINSYKKTKDIKELDSAIKIGGELIRKKETCNE